MAARIPPQPPFNFNVDPATLLEVAEKLVASSKRVWDHVAQISSDKATFITAIVPIINDENERLTRSRLLTFLKSVAPSKELRDTSQEVDLMLDRDRVNRFSGRDVFAVVDAVWHRKEEIDDESRLYLDEIREQFIHTGMGLENEDAREQVSKALVRLKELTSQYLRNLDSDIGGLWLTIEELHGVPKSFIDQWKADGDKRWVNHKLPTLNAVLQNASRADVRQKMWMSWDNRTKDSNGPLLKEMLVLRHDLANLLGYRHHAHLRETDRIMETDQALQFLESLHEPLRHLGRQELECLKAIKTRDLQEKGAKAEPSTEPFFLWDRSYYNNKAKINAFNIDQQHVSQYFPFERCLSRMLSVLGTLFGVEFIKCTPETTEIPIWHPDVLTYVVWNDESNGGDFVGYLYLDVFPRENKYGHKGHYGIQPGFVKEDGTRHYPCAAVVTNNSPPSESRPSLLRIKEVVSCFHELGHALHNLTSRTKYARFHGTATPRDFVEIPSIMLEHVFWHRDIVRFISGRWDTEEHPDKEEKLPYELIDQLIASRFSDTGISNLSTLLLATFDMKVHTPANREAVSSMNLAFEFNKLRKDLCLMSGPEDLGLGLEAAHGYCRYRFPIGYSSVYYTYLLSRAFSYDIFETRFRPLLPSENSVKLIEEIVTAPLRDEFRRYQHMILRPGGSVPSYIELLAAFLGRSPSSEAYIKMLRTMLKRT